MSRFESGRSVRLTIACLGTLLLALSVHADEDRGFGRGDADCRASGSIELSTHVGFDIRSVLIHAIDGATGHIDVSLYKFNDTKILDAIQKALGRGVEVRMVADRKQAGRDESLVGRAETAGARVRLWKSGQKLHAKLVLIDSERALAGSFNWTKKAAENVEIVNDVRCKKTVSRYAELFAELWEQAEHD